MELEDEADSLSFLIPFDLKNMMAHRLYSSSSSQLMGDYNGAPTWRGRDVWLNVRGWCSSLAVGEHKPSDGKES